MINCNDCGTITDNGKYCRKCKAQRVCEVCDDEISGLANHVCKGPKEWEITLVLSVVQWEKLKDTLAFHQDDGPTTESGWQSDELIKLSDDITKQMAVEGI